MGFKMKYPIETMYLTPRQKGDQKYRRPGVKMSRVKFLVAHDTGNPGSTAYANIKYYERTRNQDFASAHTFIDDKHIVECIPLTTGTPEKANHVRRNVKTDDRMFGADANDVAGGVELCFGGKINNEEAYKRYVWYLAYCCYKFGLDPAKHIVGHEHLDPGRKTDPSNALKRMGKTFEQLIKDVIKEYKECTSQESKPKQQTVSNTKVQQVSFTRKQEEGEDDMLKLDKQWQWDALYNAIQYLREKGYLNSNEWEQKVKNKTLTNSELAFLNTILIQRMVGGK